jgi:hypothetical protein
MRGQIDKGFGLSRTEMPIYLPALAAGMILTSFLLSKVPPDVAP